MTAAEHKPPALRLRGRSFIAVALVPEPPVMDWLGLLDAQIERSPGFFAGRPVVLDLSAMALHEPGIRALLTALRERKIHVIGMEGATEEVRGLDVPGWPPMLSGGRPAGAIEPPEPPTAGPDAPAEPETPAPAPDEAPDADEPNSLLIAHGVRSGQSVTFPRGDVTVMGSVASGAEVMAGGSIHVYGTLRGRAVAGMMGNPEARIFCRRMEAELLAIDGLYRTAEDMDAGLHGRPVQAWLDRDSIRMAPLD